MADILDGSDSDGEVKLTINKNYAERYDHWRGKEEVQKFTARYGEDALAKIEDSDDDSSTSTEEDEDAKEITPQLEKQFFKALSCLKKKDPKIYDASTRFFDGKETKEQTAASSEKTKKKKKEKSMFLRDYERKILLERGGQLSSDEEENSTIARIPSPTFVQEQQEIQHSFKKALKDSSDEEGEQESGIGGLFRPRQKTKEEKFKEEEDYREWLVGRKAELKNEEDVEDLGYLKSYWNDPKLDKGEAYLRDYIINKRYLDTDNVEDGDPKALHDSDNNLSEDECTEEQMEQFEHKYNFRFEEPDQEFVKRYPRTMTGSFRQQDDKRKTHREVLKERKEKEKEAKRQELKQLKAIKRKEIAERLEKLKQITGNTDITFEQDDLNEDFDPEKHDQRMQNLFNEEFYQAEEDDEKPEFADLDEELEIENWDQYEIENTGEDGSRVHEPHCEDPDFIMDCDYDPRASLQQEMIASQQPRSKKSRKRSLLAQTLSKQKPKFDPNKQEVEKYMDEYYGLDYEDVIGDLPCRFKYRTVVPNSYGLTIEEILMADDKELNRWCSLKKTCQYRPEATELYDVQAYAKKGQLEELKRKIMPSLYTNEEEENENSQEQTEKKKKRRKKKKKKVTDTASNHYENTESAENSIEANIKIEDNRGENVEANKSTVKDTSKNKKSTSNDTDTPVKAKKRKAEQIDAIEESQETTSTLSSKKKKVSKEEEITLKDKKHGSTHNSSEQQSSKKKKQKVSKEKSISNQQPYKAKKHQGYGGIGNQMKKKKNKKNGMTDESGQKTNGSMPISDSRLKAYGINPKKYKNKMKYGKKTM